MRLPDISVNRIKNAKMTAVICEKRPSDVKRLIAKSMVAGVKKMTNARQLNARLDNEPAHTPTVHMTISA